MQCMYRNGPRKVHVRLPVKGNSNSHGARPVHLNITIIQWIRTSRLSIKNALSIATGRGGALLDIDDGREDARHPFWIAHYPQSVVSLRTDKGGLTLGETPTAVERIWHI